MDRVVKPILKGRGGAVSKTDDSRSDRLLKYVQPDVAGFYAIAQPALEKYKRNELPYLSEQILCIIVFVACILAGYWLLYRQYRSIAMDASAKRRVFLIQSSVSTIAFVLWSYSIHSLIWGDSYATEIAIILTGIFVLFASNYAPKVTPEEVRQKPQ